MAFQHGEGHGTLSSGSTVGHDGFDSEQIVFSRVSSIQFWFLDDMATGYTMAHHNGDMYV